MAGRRYYSRSRRLDSSISATKDRLTASGARLASHLKSAKVERDYLKGVITYLEALKKR